MIPPLAQLTHANLVVGNRRRNLEELRASLASQGIAAAGNPDFLLFEGEQFLTADAESVIRSVSSKSLSGSRFVVISADRVAADVQNVLLKTLEEPQPGTSFFLLLPDAAQVIPTVLSRVRVIEGDRSAGDSRLDVGDFLAKGLPERFAYVETWTKAKKDEDNASKGEVLAFIAALEAALWSGGSRDEELFRDIRTMRGYAAIRGASHRVILDYLAMIAPRG